MENLQNGGTGRRTGGSPNASARKMLVGVNVKSNLNSINISLWKLGKSFEFDKMKIIPQTLPNICWAFKAVTQPVCITKTSFKKTTIIKVESFLSEMKICKLSTAANNFTARWGGNMQVSKQAIYASEREPSITITTPKPSQLPFWPWHFLSSSLKPPWAGGKFDIDFLRDVKAIWIQLTSSSLANQWGAYFSAVFGRKFNPTTVLRPCQPLACCWRVGIASAPTLFTSCVFCTSSCPPLMMMKIFLMDVSAAADLF